MNSNVNFVQLTSDELEKLLDYKLSQHTERMERKLLEKKADDELLTRDETAKFLQCDISTLHNWVKKGKLNVYGIGNRRYFKRSELLESLTLIKNK